MSNRTSCIAHPDDNLYIIIRADYMAVSECLNLGTGRRVARLDDSGKTIGFEIDGLHSQEIVRCGAALLHYFERWTNTKLAEAEQAKYKREEADPWIYGMSAQRIENDTLGMFPAKTISKTLDWLIETPLLYRRNNPHNGLDKSFQYILDYPIVQAMIDAIYQKTAETLAVVDCPSRVYRSTLQGVSMCPPGGTYNIHYKILYKIKEYYEAQSRDNADVEHRPSAVSHFDQEDQTGNSSNGSGNGSANRIPNNPFGVNSIETQTSDGEVSSQNKSKTVPPRNSPKKEKQTYPELEEEDDNGILQIPDAPVYKLLRPLILKSVQIELCRDWLDFEFDINEEGRVTVDDRKNFDDFDEDTAFVKFFPFQKMVDILIHQEGVNIEAINNSLLEWTDYWVKFDRTLRASKKSLRQAIAGKDVALLIKDKIDLEFESEKTEEYDDIPF